MINSNKSSLSCKLKTPNNGDDNVGNTYMYIEGLMEGKQLYDFVICNPIDNKVVYKRESKTSSNSSLEFVLRNLDTQEDYIIASYSPEEYDERGWTNAAFSPDNEHLVFVEYEGRVTSYNVKSHNNDWSVKINAVGDNNFAINWSRNKLIEYSQYSKPYILDVCTGIVLDSLEENFVYAQYLDANSDDILAYDSDGYFKIYHKGDVAHDFIYYDEQKGIFTILDGVKRVNYIAAKIDFSFDGEKRGPIFHKGRYVIKQSNSNMISCYNKNYMYNFLWRKTNLLFNGFSNDGSFILVYNVAGDYNSVPLLLNSNNGEIMVDFTTLYRDIDWYNTRVAFSTDGKYIIFDAIMLSGEQFEDALTNKYMYYKVKSLEEMCRHAKEITHGKKLPRELRSQFYLE